MTNKTHDYSETTVFLVLEGQKKMNIHKYPVKYMLQHSPIQLKDTTLSMDKIQELSKELQGINKELETTENEWLDLSED